MKKMARKILRALADYAPDYYDMYADANETFFAQLYLEPIIEHAAAAGLRPPATLVEAGCQTGRLAVPFAQRGFRVTGIERSVFALRRARRHATAAGVHVEWVRGDLVSVLQRHPQERYDIVVCAEVVYLSPQHRQMVQVLADAVRPGGILCVSHRPRFYYLMEALRQYDVATAAEVLRRAEGPFRETAYYNWQTMDALRELYESVGLRWVASHSIDRLAWLSGMNPSKLSESQRQQLLEMERTLADEDVGCARYVLMIAQRPAAG